jgi:hypothetical protein
LIRLDTPDWFLALDHNSWPRAPVVCMSCQNCGSPRLAPAPRHSGCRTPWHSVAGCKRGLPGRSSMALAITAVMVQLAGAACICRASPAGAQGASTRGKALLWDSQRSTWRAAAPPRGSGRGWVCAGHRQKAVAEDGSVLGTAKRQWQRMGLCRAPPKGGGCSRLQERRPVRLKGWGTDGALLHGMLKQQQLSSFTPWQVGPMPG